MPDDPPSAPESAEPAMTVPTHALPRRAVLDIALVASAGGLCAMAAVPIVRFATPPGKPEVGGVSAIAGKRDAFEEQTSRLVVLDNEPVIVVALPGGEFRAFSARCTHLGCIVQYNRASEHFECPCHGGRFGTDGRVVAGPPPSALREFNVEVRAGDVVVVRG